MTATTTALAIAAPRHRFGHCQTLNEIGRGTGGRALIVSSPDRAPYYAGVRRHAARTLLEAALTWLDTRRYDGILMFTGSTSAHLPELKITDTLVCGHAETIWWFKGAPVPPATTATAATADDEVTLIRKRAPKPQTVVGQPMPAAKWPDRLTTLVDAVDRFMKETERRLLFVIDEAMLLPTGRAGDESEYCTRAQMNTLARRFTSLATNIAPTRHDIVVLACSAQSAASLKAGTLIRDALVADVARDASDDDKARHRRQASTAADHFSPLHWPSAQEIKIPSRAGGEALGPWMMGADGGAAPYISLRVTPMSVRQSPLEQMNDLIGMKDVKAHLQEIESTIKSIQEVKKRGLPGPGIGYLHLALMGPPGTGKSSIARIVASIYRDLGVLTKGHLIQVTPADLIGETVGGTRPKTRELFRRAHGGVLFIDEAYGLHGTGEYNYGKEAIEEMLVWTENPSEDLAVIIAGYEKEVLQMIAEGNPGLDSRFKKKITVPPYDDDELVEIAHGFARLSNQTLERDALPALRYALTNERARAGDKFGNARAVRNLLESAARARSLRLSARLSTATNAELLTITADDIRSTVGQ